MKLSHTAKGVFVAATLLAIQALPANAMHPLITDDTGVQGKGKTQLEVNGEYNYDKERLDGVSVKEKEWQLGATLSYGITNEIDLVLTTPYRWTKGEENGLTTARENGLSDATLEAKWRFWEHEGSSLAIKPGIILPTGDEDKGLGAGKVGYSLFLIGTQEMKPFTFHANLGYKRSENCLNEREDIWHASIAAEWEVMENLKLVANTGIETNPERDSNTDPAFLLGGVVYSVNEDLDLDAGVKFGLNDVETDYTLLAGLTYRF